MSNNSRAPEPVKDSQAAKIRLTLMAKRHPAFAEFAERLIESLPENADFGRTIAFLDSLLESAHNLDQARDIGQETVRLAELRSAAAAAASTACQQAMTSDAGLSMLSPAHVSKKKRVADDANLTVDITPS